MPYGVFFIMQGQGLTITRWGMQSLQGFSEIGHWARNTTQYFASILWWQTKNPICFILTPHHHHHPPFSPSLVHWSPTVRTCDWLLAKLQSGYTHHVSHQSLASPSWTPPPLPAAPAGTQTGRLWPETCSLGSVLVSNNLYLVVCTLLHIKLEAPLHSNA